MKPSETMAGSAERQLFVRALEKPAGKERNAFLDGACVDNPALRQRLEALLQKFETLGTFLEAPAVSGPETNEREKSLFAQALELPSAGERLAFLKGACGED